jgi:choline dehydrogenase-like flavoprotein
MATTYDLITVGGGIGGAALAGAMAERGARVLVLERENKFKECVARDSYRGASKRPADGLYEMLRDRVAALKSTVRPALAASCSPRAT